MNSLIDGYRRFRAETWPRQRARFEALTAAQRPETMVIACSDSRADPQMIFDAAPGELFTVRNVAALVPPYQPDGGLHGVSAALEFGVRVLGVGRIVVMGHARCGGVQALREGAPATAQEFVQPWMAVAAPALERGDCAVDGDSAQEACEREVVKLSLDNLRTFPWIAEPEAAGRLALIGAHFAIATGVLWTTDADGRFEAVVGG